MAIILADIFIDRTVISFIVYEILHSGIVISCPDGNAQCRQCGTPPRLGIVKLVTLESLLLTVLHALRIRTNNQAKGYRNHHKTGRCKTAFLGGLRSYMSNKKVKKTIRAEKREQAMIEGILEGSPDGIGVVVIRLECGCRKMAAVAADGEPASKLIMYRDQAQSICDKCKEDNGSFVRVTESFIHWVEPSPSEEKQREISIKVLGSPSSH